MEGPVSLNCVKSVHDENFLTHRTGLCSCLAGIGICELVMLHRVHQVFVITLHTPVKPYVCSYFFVIKKLDVADTVDVINII